MEVTLESDIDEKKNLLNKKIILSVLVAQHTSSNASHSTIPVTNPVQPINSVMVAVDSRHHVALHPPYSTSGMNVHILFVWLVHF